MSDNQACLNWMTYGRMFAEGKVFYESKRLEIGKMIRELCKWKEVNLIEGEVCLDHVHILVEIPLKLSVSSFMGFLKGKTSIMIYQKYGNMKHEVGANQACLNLLACRPTKCQLNEVKTNLNIETEIFGVGDNMWIQPEKMQRKFKNTYKIS